jgi:hypothetical protein
MVKTIGTAEEPVLDRSIELAGELPPALRASTIRRALSRGLLLRTRILRQRDAEVDAHRLWTAQREGDILRLGRARYDGAGFKIRQGRPEAKRAKGRMGKVVELYIRAAKPLREHLASCEFPGVVIPANFTHGPSAIGITQ